MIEFSGIFHFAGMLKLSVKYHPLILTSCLLGLNNSMASTVG